MKRFIPSLCLLALLGCGARDVEIFSGFEDTVAAETRLLAAPPAALARASKSEQTASLKAAYLAVRMKEAESEREFSISQDFTVVSQAGHLRAGFGERGARVRSISAGIEARLQTVAAGCLGATSVVAPVSPQSVRAAANRLVYQHQAGTVTFREHWVNGEPGLEQSFVVDEVPCRTRFRIELAVDGLRPSVQNDASVVLEDDSGTPQLHYTDLYAYDSAGRILPARFSTEGSRIALDVDVAGAAWPIVIDPLLVTDEVKLSQQLALQDTEFGSAVALDGDTALVGAPRGPAGGYRGAAYVFVRQGTLWFLQARLTPADRAPDVDGFGSAVALNGDVAMVGAPADTRAAGIGQGSVRVFVRSGESWSEEQILTAPDAKAQARFGNALAMSGNRAIVGATFEDIGPTYAQGSAYILRNDGAAWEFEQQLLADDAVAGDQLGFSVALSGERAIVGAPWATPSRIYSFAHGAGGWVQEQRIDDVSQTGFGWSVAVSGDRALAGAPSTCFAYVFARSGAAWSLERTLTDGDDFCDNNFGASVALEGERALVGAYDTTVYLNAHQGAVYLYDYDGGQWTRHDLWAQVGSTYQWYGWSVALDGEQLLVGATLEKVGEFANQGAAYVVEHVGNDWVQQKRLVQSDGSGGDLFGSAVAAEGDRALIGAYNWKEERGAVYYFARGATGWVNEQRLVASDRYWGDRFGCAVAMYGDRAIVGSNGADVDPLNFDNRGAAYFFEYDGAKWVEEQKYMPAEGFTFGAAVAMGQDRAIVGAPGGQPGKAYVLVRKVTGWEEEQQLDPSASSPNTQFGYSVALEGDTALVGAPFFDDGKGSAEAFVLANSTWQSQQLLSVNGGKSGDNLGWAVALSGETALVGAPERYGNGPGAAYVFVRSGQQWSQQAKLVASDGLAFDYFGDAVSLEGDSALIGAPAVDVDAQNTIGAAYVFVRSGTSWFEQPRLMASDGKASDWFGRTVALDGTRAFVSAPVDYSDPDYGTGTTYVLTLKGLAGSACQLPEDCALSYSCVDGVCCTTSCEGPCEVCSAARGAVQDGTCTPKAQGQSGDNACPANVTCDGIHGSCPPVCEGDQDCPETSYCALGGCVGKHGQGVACDGSNECSTPGGCVDGFCCNETCAGSCEVCSAALGSGANGVCAAKNAATAGAPPCPGDILCDGTSRECPSECSSKSDCATSDFCELETGSCKSKKPDGARCVANSECSNARCEDGVCCESVCDGQCEWCADPSRPGECVAVEGQPQGDRAPCNGAGNTCGGVCNGAKRDGCEFPGGGTVCGDPATCENDSVRAPSTCDGAGQCQRGALADCGAYSCDSLLSECKTSCTTSADCRSGAVCDTSEGVGTCNEQGTTCQGGYDVKTPAGVVSSCAGFACVAGACQTRCTAELGCAPGYSCVELRCEKNAIEANDAGARDDGGCGCRLQRTSHDRAWTRFMAALALLSLCVRKRQGRRRAAA